MGLYKCGLLVNYSSGGQLIPDDGLYHIVRFPYGPAPGEEQTDVWEMHSPTNHVDGHIVTDWENDDYAGLIFPHLNGEGLLIGKINWSTGNGEYKDQFCRDPLEISTGKDWTATEGPHSLRYHNKLHSIYVEPNTPVSLRVHNGSGFDRYITHAQFKLIINPDIAAPDSASC